MDQIDAEILAIWSTFTAEEKADALNRIAEMFPHLLPHRVLKKAA